jgi:hypothetical protein
MIPASKPRVRLLSRTALGLALSLGLAVGGFVSQPAQAKSSAPKVEYSANFQKAAAPIQKAISDATSKLPSPPTDAALKAAGAQVNAALGGDANAKFAEAQSAVSTPGDKLALGDMMRIYGALASDPATSLRGNVMMIESGALPADKLAKANFDAGIAAYQSKDYASAVRYLKAAKDANYQDPTHYLDPVLADSYKRTNNPAAALQLAQQEVTAARAAGTKPSENSIRTALQAAYDAKQAGPAVDLATLLVQDYPTAASWGSAISVVRALAPMDAQATLDLMRLMDRTGSFTDTRDYDDYIQAADPRRFPAEVLKVISEGTAAGKLQPSNTMVAEARTQANGRLAQDKASLASYARDAKAPGASEATVTGAADTLLSFGQDAQAEELYKIALTKSGVDTQRALTRLGIAQVDQGKYADAQATFAKVTGPRKVIAQLWSAYAAQKAGGGAPAQ